MLVTERLERSELRAEGRGGRSVSERPISNSSHEIRAAEKHGDPTSASQTATIDYRSLTSSAQISAERERERRSWAGL